MASTVPRMLLFALLAAGLCLGQDTAGVADTAEPPASAGTAASTPQETTPVLDADPGTGEPAARETAADAPEPEPLVPTPSPRPGRLPPVDPLDATCVGLRLSYFYYHELFPEHQLLEDYNVDRIEGEPKSAEYGPCEGVHLEFVHRVRGRDVFLRPKLDAVLGSLHKYDGSSHGGVDTATRVATFAPLEGVKNNYFLNGGLDVGVGFLRRTSGVAVWSGIGGRLWKRRLWDDDEYYYWFSLPLGLRGWVPAGRRWTVGLDLSVDFMLAGWMKLVLGAEAGEESPDIPAVRLSDGVAFGRRASVAVGLPLELRAGPRASVRFTPWFEYYHFERSNNEELPDGGWFYEPASRTFVWGVGTDIVVHQRQER